MRFFASFHYAQNDSKLGDFGHLGGVFLWLRRKTIPPKYAKVFKHLSFRCEARNLIKLTGQHCNSKQKFHKNI